MRAIGLLDNILEQIKNTQIYDQLEFDYVLAMLKMIITNVFGEVSGYLRDLESIRLEQANDREHAVDYIQAYWPVRKAQLENLIYVIIEDIISFGDSRERVTSDGKVEDLDSQNVFVVHGHDEAMKESVARTIGKLGLNPIILHEQPDQGRTIIEKFTDYSNVGFAVVLLSPDDMGYSVKAGEESTKFRARQNVILELGFFLGKLGRRKVVVLHKGSVELPSDYHGVLYTPFDNDGAWRLKLVQELKACGYEVRADDLIVV